MTYVLEHSNTFPRRCIHFRGMSEHDTCAANVAYRDVRLEHDPPVQYRYKGQRTPYVQTCSYPCFSDRAFGATCDKALFPTPVEVAAYESETRRLLDRTMTARTAIVATIAMMDVPEGESCSGAIPCPVCATGTLKFDRAGCNGHIHACCTTENCVAWME